MRGRVQEQVNKNVIFIFKYKHVALTWLFFENVFEYASRVCKNSPITLLRMVSEQE